jgi:hypothetical protein
MANIKTLKVQARISLGVLAIGLVLMTYMITVESAPGALPLFLVLLGGGGYGVSRYRLRRLTAI